MDKKPLIRKGLAVGIVLLFVGVTVAQGITLNAKQLSLPKSSQNIISNPEKIKLSCCYFTVDGVEQVVNEVTIQDANYLSQLMNGSDVDAIVSELNRLNLLPKTVSIEQAEALVSGRYGQKIFQQSQKTSHSMLSLDTDWKENFNCNISGHGVDAYFMTLRAYRFLTALDWFLYYTFTSFGFELGNILSLGGRLEIVFYLIVAPFLIPQFLVESYLLDIGQFINPIKLAPGKIFAELYEASFEPANPPFLNTSGTNGTWSIENYNGIAMYMENFYGTWLTYHEPGHLGAYMKGYCSNIHAKGQDKYGWNRYWGDDDWPWS